MAIFSKKLCEQKLRTWLEAEDAIATGQRYQIEDRSLTRADLHEVRKEIEFWTGQLAADENEEKYGGRNRMFRFVPRDL